MKNFFYKCKVNLSHPDIAEVFEPKKNQLFAESDITGLTLVSKMYHDSTSVWAAADKDISEKFKTLLTRNPKKSYGRINEMNPNSIEPEELTEIGKEDPEFLDYVNAWDPNMLCKIICADAEDINMTDEADTTVIASIPSSYVFKYEIMSVEDSIVAPLRAIMPINISSAIN